MEPLGAKLRIPQLGGGESRDSNDQLGILTAGSEFSRRLGILTAARNSHGQLGRRDSGFPRIRGGELGILTVELEILTVLRRESVWYFVRMSSCREESIARPPEQ